MVWHRFALFVVSALAVACVRIGAYECAGDDACVAREGGRCESTNYCSYPDEGCDSGARYSRHAGVFAHQCTENAGTTSTSSSGTTTSSTSATTLAGSSSSTSSDDGTTTDDPQPGDVLWVFFHDGGVGNDAFRTAAALSDGGFIVGGYQAVAGQSLDVLLARYTGPGVATWTVTRDFAGGLDDIDDLLFSPGGSVFVTGEHLPDAGVYQSWTGCFRADDGSECWIEPTIGFAGRGVAYGVDNLLVVVGSHSPQSGGFVSVRHNWGQLAWEHVFADGELLSAVAIGSAKYVGGYQSGRIFLGAVDELGITPLAIVDGPAAGPDAIQQLASDGETIVGVGYVATQTSRNGWIGAFALDGALLWESSEGPADLDEELESVTIDDAGIVYAVGYATDVDKDTLIASWTIDGTAGVWRSDLEIGQGDDIARDVVVLEDGILVVGEARGEDDFLDAYALLLAP